jgi:hypothetical protein
MINKITRELLHEWGACYTDERIAALVPPEGVTPLEVCDAIGVPAVDRLWVLTRPKVLTPREAAAFARECAAWAVLARDRAAWAANAADAAGAAARVARVARAAADTAAWAAADTADAAAWAAAAAAAAGAAEAAGAAGAAAWAAGAAAGAAAAAWSARAAAAAWSARAAAADRERLRQLGAIRRLIAERNTK